MERSKRNDYAAVTQALKDKHCFENKEHKKVSARMYDYNCDVKLNVGKKTFQAHREVLANASDYFAAMFSHDMQEKQKDAIEIHEISPVGFDAMMNYFYFGRVTLEDAIVADVIEAARFCQVEWLVNACCLYLIRHTSIENFDSVLELADQFALGDLRYDIYKFLGDNFVALAKNNRFLSMSLELFLQLLGDDFYIEAPEGLILQTVVDWLQFDPEERKPHFETLMKLIRFPLLDPEELQSVPEEIKQNAEIEELIAKAQDYFDCPFKQCLVKSDEIKFRGSREVLGIMSINEGMDMIQYKDPHLKQGKFIQESFNTDGLECLMEHGAVATFGNFLFIAGGYNRSFFSTNAVYCYDQRFKTWIEAAPMLEPRCNFVLCASDSVLYAVGGINHDVQDEEHALNSVEVFDPNTNEWSFTTPLRYPTFDHAATVAGGNLFISGGITENPKDSIPDNHLYELYRQTSALVVDKCMTVARKGHTMVSYKDSVFVFGGYTSQSMDGTASDYSFSDCFVNEMYDLKTEQWTIITSTPELYGHFERDAGCIGSTIYLIGSQNPTCRYLYSFDAETKEFVDREALDSNYMKLATLSIAFPNDLLQDESELEGDNDCAGN